MRQDEWAKGLVAVIAESVRRHRRNRGMSAQQLADECGRLGYSIPRSVLTNLENGRRETVSIAEWLALADALDVPPLVLISPLGSAESVEVLPGGTEDAWTAYRWLTGEFPTEMLGKQRDPAVLYTRSDETAERVNLYRRHHTALHTYLLQRSQNPHIATQHLGVLGGTRIAMHQQSLWLPPIPNDVRDALQEPLLAWGYREDPPGQIVKVPGYLQAGLDDQAGTP